MSKTGISISSEAYDNLVVYREKMISKIGVSRLTLTQAVELAIRDAMAYNNVPSHTFRVRDKAIREKETSHE